MTIYQLLETLLDKLSNISSAVRTYPEAKQTLVIAIDRLAQLSSEGFQITRIPSNARPAVKTRIDSMTAAQLSQNQRPPVTQTGSMI